MIEEWLHYGVRLFHLIAGIMWIGTSFYFVWLDFSFTPLAEKQPGVEGETYMVHGGFFYRVEKQRPLVMPKVLHWFKYEALLTWVSGVFLLGLVFWLRGGLALVDLNRYPMTGTMAIGVSIGTLIAGWLVYDFLWALIGALAPRLALLLSLLLGVGAIYGYCSVFSGRAAFLHVGAMFGTVMVANVWMRILPNQRRMIAASLAGKEPDWARGAGAKQRSLHNSYMTIPVLITMVSNHFSFAFDHPLNWVLLTILCIVGASIRHLMITFDRSAPAYWAVAPALVGLGLVVALTSAKFTGSVRAAEPLNSQVSWVGNSFPGADDKWVQNFFIHTKVQPDGTVNTWSHWDEGGRKFGVYKDGDVIGNKDVEANSLEVTDKAGRRWKLEVIYTDPKHQEWEFVPKEITCDGKAVTFPELFQPMALALANDGALMVALSVVIYWKFVALICRSWWTALWAKLAHKA